MNKKDFAYTSESDVNSEQKAKAVETIIKWKKEVPTIKPISMLPKLNVKIVPNLSKTKLCTKGISAYQ